MFEKNRRISELLFFGIRITALVPNTRNQVSEQGRGLAGARIIHEAGHAPITTALFPGRPEPRGSRVIPRPPGRR
jgi:hypothetical protein